jgi:hypothetical protein
MRLSKNLTYLLPAVFAAMILQTPSAHAATLTGDSITCSATGFSCSAPSAIDGTGVEFVLSDGAPLFPDLLDADFTATGLILSNPSSNDSFEDFGNLSLVFTDSSNPFTYASLLSASRTNFGAGSVSLSGGTLTLSVGYITFNTHASVDIDLVPPAATPEPSSLILLSTGILGVLGAARRRFVR